ncbi:MULTISPECIES: dynamin family protein [Bacillus]|uniref:GTP-binding protein n=1 Tax=Bacillus cereus TaxID=1396 RepID=A0A2A8IUY9_BACCE|nr:MULTISPECIES: dynamin family protein [Bacillus]MDH4419883.1 dynamin family protein [Bacillus cereus]PER23443.1 GTP-binding protein [Bacillus cereus]PFA65303.1 GTP-binding protein [Bacillus sp. AFS015896]PGL87223.1 GTP-binding protein [Bacillus sp. AFS054943]PGU05303.1 GTP-binding protein [Bacillus cereus]
MRLEKQLIKKMYYETFLMENETQPPLQVLGEAYVNEEKDEVSDGSYIRFAQGEYYYHHQDFEAAIFKWEQVSNELAPWAQKNIADAYFELNRLSVAENVYTSIITDNKILMTEIGLQLLSLYIEQNNFEAAFTVIKEAVSLNPDYPNVTIIARSFYEEQQDFDSAVELAVNELIRIESYPWFEVLKGYIDKGFTKHISPDYFYKVLVTLNNVDQVQFTQMVSSLWSSYKNEQNYLLWLNTINEFFLHIEIHASDIWDKISSLYEETYLELIQGQYMLRQLNDIIPNLLTNWLKVVNPSQAVFPSAAVLAWDEIFPSKIDSVNIEHAENLLLYSINHVNGLEDSLHLFESITQWAQKHDIEMGHRLRWLVGELADLRTNRILVTGTSGNGKTAFINSILGENILENSISNVVVLKNDAHTEINAITESAITTTENFFEYHDMMSLHRQTYRDRACVEFKLPCRFLSKNKLAFVVTPGFNRNNDKRDEILEYLNSVDELLFVLNADSPFTDKERDILLSIQEQTPNLQIHFLLNKIDNIYSEAEVKRVLHDTQARINAYFPYAKIFPYSSLYTSSQQLNDLTEFIRFNFNHKNIDAERTEKLLFFIRKTITYLLDKRVEKENNLVDSINWNEDMLVKLNGCMNNLTAFEKEKIHFITESYRTMKAEITNDLTEHIPKLLQSCSDLISEESDFGHIDVELNKAMNERVHKYLEQTVLPNLARSMQNWIATSNNELLQSQSYLEELSEGLNSLFGENRIQLECDFKVLDDWRRDTDRMTTGIQMEEVNILRRFTPAQFLLKSAGKLFGVLPKNRAMLYNKYKQYLENEDYTEATASIMKKFFLQFELFENTQERDINMFFRNPFSSLKQAVENTHLEIQDKQEILHKMKSNPEVYQDSIKLFELRLRQCEVILHIGEDHAYTDLTLETTIE